jgi:hypothetical protein
VEIYAFESTIYKVTNPFPQKSHFMYHHLKYFPSKSYQMTIKPCSVLHNIQKLRTKRKVPEVPRVTLRQTPVFWNAKPCRLVSSYRHFESSSNPRKPFFLMLYPEDKSTTILRNFGNYRPVKAAKNRARSKICRSQQT